MQRFKRRVVLVWEPYFHQWGRDRSTSFTAELQTVPNFLASIWGYVTFVWQSIFCFQFLNAGFSLVAAVWRCVSVFVSVIFLPFLDFIPFMSISPLHLWVSQGVIKYLEVKGVLSGFIKCYHTSLSSAPSNWLQIQKKRTCLEHKAKSWFKRTCEESDTCWDPKVNWDKCGWSPPQLA